MEWLVVLLDILEVHPSLAAVAVILLSTALVFLHRRVHTLEVAIVEKPNLDIVHGLVKQETERHIERDMAMREAVSRLTINVDNGFLRVNDKLDDIGQRVSRIEGEQNAERR